MDTETEPKRTPLRVARDERDSARRDADAARMVASYLLAARAPDLDLSWTDPEGDDGDTVRVRAFGLHRHDGGYIVITRGGYDIARTYLAIDWQCGARRYVDGDDVGPAGRESLWFRDVAEPALRRATFEAITLGRRGF